MLTDSEIDEVRKILGRQPNDAELGMFEIMWSEHCSYKSSRTLLSEFLTGGDDVLVGPGDDAAVVRITDKYAIAVGMESHNHPSAIEPVAGAATGVGGIIRDIISMGARPIAVLDPLRFGDINDERSRYLFENIVKGIANYGNTIGVPTVGGECVYDRSFNGNPLVNVVGIGLVETGKYLTATSKKAGDPIILVGASTGRDGIHGVSFASEELSDDSEEDRPAVQIGDPFTEKLLIEMTMEAVSTGYIVGCKDLGGGGFTCACSEMVAKGGKGAVVDISRIHQREQAMSAYEILLSESQERMLFIVDRGHEKDILKICEKYDLTGVVIGEVVDDLNFTVMMGDKIAAQMPISALAKSPVIERQSLAEQREKDIAGDFEEPQRNPQVYNKILLEILSSPNVASNRWVYRQYDHEVQLRGIVKPGDDAAVLRIANDTNTVLAVSTDCNSYHTFLNPYMGGAGACAEAVRNIVSMGAKPICVVDCLNFGNPEKPAQFWEFKQAVMGMAEFLRYINVPVVGGNVSFYNETKGKAVKPSPVVCAIGKIDLAGMKEGIVGIMNDNTDDMEFNKYIATKDFKHRGDVIILLGDTDEELGGSEYYRSMGIDAGFAPRVDFKAAKDTNSAVLELIGSGLLNSCHDLSSGGLAVCIAECIEGGLGAEIDLEIKSIKESSSHGGTERVDYFLFSESHSRFLVSAGAGDAAAIRKVCDKFNVNCRVIGIVEGAGLKVKFDGQILIDLAGDEIADARRAIEKIMD